MGLRFFEAPPCRFPQCGANCSDVFQEVTGRALPAIALGVLIGSAVLFTATVVRIAMRLREPATGNDFKAGLRKIIAAALLVGSFSSAVAAGGGLLLNPALSASSRAVTFFATSVAALSYSAGSVTLLYFLFTVITGESGIEVDVSVENARRAGIAATLGTLVMIVIVSILVATVDLDNVLALRLCFGVFAPVSTCSLFISRLIEAPMLASLEDTMQAISSLDPRDDSPLVARVRTLKTEVRIICQQGEILGCILPPLFIVYLTTSLLEIPWVGVVASFLGFAPFFVFHPLALSVIFPFRRTSVHPSPHAHAVSDRKKLVSGQSMLPTTPSIGASRVEPVRESD